MLQSGSIASWDGSPGPSVSRSGTSSEFRRVAVRLSPVVGPPATESDNPKNSYEFFYRDGRAWRPVPRYVGAQKQRSSRMGNANSAEVYLFGLAPQRPRGCRVVVDWMPFSTQFANTLYSLCLCGIFSAGFLGGIFHPGQPWLSDPCDGEFSPSCVACGYRFYVVLYQSSSLPQSSVSFLKGQ